MRESVLAQARHTQIALLAKIFDFKVRSTESERFQRAKSKSFHDEVLLRRVVRRSFASLEDDTGKKLKIEN